MHTPLPQWAFWSEAIIRVGWAAIAVVLFITMSRRAHDGEIWAIVAVVLGPLAVPAAMLAAARASRRHPIVVDEGEGGRIDVLAVIDPDEPQTWAAVAHELNALALGAELVVVVSRDTLDAAARDAALRRARAALGAVASAISGRSPRQIILEGRPAKAVRDRREVLGVAIVVTPTSRLGDRLRAELDEHRVVLAPPPLASEA